jgi:hypothetical protein
MTGFDIKTLVDFKPAQYWCEKCLALIDPPWYSKSYFCPVCNVEYVPADGDFGIYKPKEYLKENGYMFEFNNLLKHSKSLAFIAKMAASKEVPPLRLLFKSLFQAKHFVHFTTYGISHILIGALKLTSMKIPVRGIVSNANPNTFKELTEYREESPLFDIKAYAEGDDWTQIPHQKLIIIDGLLAFKGSVNLTLNAWRKSAVGKDLLEVVTNVNEVVSLHNRLFSPVWKEVSDIGRTIEMGESPF